MVHYRIKECALAVLATAATALAFDQTFTWNSSGIVETRSLDQIHQAALQEGGVVTLWHGGSANSQQDPLKNAFEERFPGMTLNVTVRGSSYLGVDIDRQLAIGKLEVDMAMLQTLHDFPRWRDHGVLLNYKPEGFDAVYQSFKDIDGAWASSSINAWSILYNKDKLKGVDPPLTYLDFLKPEFKNKIILAYPQEDDAVMHTFDLILREYGLEYFEALLKQNPRWDQTPSSAPGDIFSPNSSYIATFTSTIGLASQGPLIVHYPTEGAQFTSWAQGSAIFKDAPHLESAKLLQAFVLSEEWQSQSRGWSVRKDVAAPEGYKTIFETTNTDPGHFAAWMMDRQEAERLRFWFYDKLVLSKET